jgi:hypothetical protein
MIDVGSRRSWCVRSQRQIGWKGLKGFRHGGRRMIDSMLSVVLRYLVMFGLRSEIDFWEWGGCYDVEIDEDLRNVTPRRFVCGGESKNCGYVAVTKKRRRRRVSETLEDG